MKRPYASSPTPTDAVADEVMERMHRADSLVQQWVEPAFRARIDPDVPEVVGPPTRLFGGRIRRRV
jgi:hypothetical protein